MSPDTARAVQALAELILSIIGVGVLLPLVKAAISLGELKRDHQQLVKGQEDLAKSFGDFTTDFRRFAEQVAAKLGAHTTEIEVIKSQLQIRRSGDRPADMSGL